MNVRTHKISDSRTLYYIENKNIKTVIMWVMYYMPQDEKASLNALLSKVLMRGSKTYRTTMDITKYLYSNYGATFGTDINLKGEVYTLGIYTNFVNDKLIPGEKDIFGNMTGFLREILYNPLIDDEGFKKDIIDIEKENLISSIKGKSNNKDAYTFDKCIELMCGKEPYGIDRLGKIEWAEGITNSELLERYYKIVNDAPCNIYALGDLDFEVVKNIIQKSFDNDKSEVFYPQNVMQIGEGVKEFKENSDVAQTKLCMGFRTNIDLNDKDFPSLVVFNKIFGGGPESRLFIELREKEGLCYNVFSTIEKYKGLLFAACGVEIGKGELAKEEIINIFKEIQQGNIDDKEFVMHINSCVKDYEDIKDDNYSYISFLQGLNIYNCNYDLDDLIFMLKKVTKEEVIECSRKIKLDTIFLLEGR